MDKKTIIGLVGLIVWVCGISTAMATDPSNGDYDVDPVFIVDSVKPNILIILSNSKSMNRMAYGQHDDGNYHPDDFGAIVDGTATGGSATTLVDSDASFSSKVAVNDILHNIDDGSTGTITAITNGTTLAISGAMTDSNTNDATERYWVEHTLLKTPSIVSEGYYGYFPPKGKYNYASNIFGRNDAAGVWSGNFLNWLSMRRVDVARKVLVGGKMTSRMGGGNTHLIGEIPTDYEFLKLIQNPTGYSPYDNRHFYKLESGDIKVFQMNYDLDYTKDFTYTGEGGDTQVLGDYTFNFDGAKYIISGSVLTGTADGSVDDASDDDSFYKHVLFDPDIDFTSIPIADGDKFKNTVDNTTAVVRAIPTTASEILTDAVVVFSAPRDGKIILYDMFKDTGANDSLVTSISSGTSYDLCDLANNATDCYTTLEVLVAEIASGTPSADANLLNDLVGHIVYLDPGDPPPNSGNNHAETYNIYYNIEATLVGSFNVKVNRDINQTDEADDFGADGDLRGVIQRIGETQARFGLEFFADDEGGDIVRNVGDSVTSMITLIQNRSTDAESPLAESVYEGLLYYQQQTTHPYPTAKYSLVWDPYEDGGFVPCADSFILQITDGETTEDLNIPDNLKDYDEDLKDKVGQANYVAYDNNGSDYLDDVTLWGNTTDLRTEADMPGTQSVKYYTVFAFGSNSTLLKDAARNGGFDDSDGNGKPEPVGGNAEKIRIEWDNDPQDGIPDTYFEAKSGNDLEEKILDAITKILKRAGSGTAVSVLSTSERGEGTVYQAFFKPQVTEGEEKIKWLGYLLALWIDEKGNLREDTVEDGALVLNEDMIIRYRFDEGTQETWIDRFSDTDGNGIIDALEDLDDDGSPDNVDGSGDPIPDSSGPLADVKPIWEAGKLLASRAPSDRTIYTFADSDWDGVVDAGEFLEFNSANLDSFKAYLDVVGDVSTNYSYLGAWDTDDATTVTDRAGNLVSFIRGTQVSGLRNREVTVTSGGSLQVWKLGDIVFSTPTVVTRPMDGYDKIYKDETYKTFANHWKERKGIVYIGANDGMLHAFRAGLLKSGDDGSTGDLEAGYFDDTDLGKEIWAYIPFNLLPHLKWLADPDYKHVYYVDLKTKVTAVKIFDGSDADHPGGWGTLLIGGMRFGGGPYPITIGGADKVFRSAYFLIDITDPDDPEVLAEFTDETLGFTTSYPSVARVGDEWFLIFGSGPTPGATAPYNYEGTSDQTARVFVLNLTDFMASKAFVVDTEFKIYPDNVADVSTDGNAFMADPIGVDKPLDYSVDAIYIGETYWAANKWNGKMFRLKTNASNNLGDWRLTTLFQTDPDQAITAAPTAGVGFYDDLWIYFGTGRLFNTTDKSDDETQTFYGIRDRCLEASANCAEVTSGMVQPVTDAVVKTDETVSGTGLPGSFDDLEALFQGAAASKFGWKMDLTTSKERALSKPSLMGGTVLFTTYIPDSEVCSMGGEGNLYALYFYTGTAYYKPILGEDAATNESLKSQSMGKGMPASLGIHVGTGTDEEGSDSGATGFIQTSTGNIVKQAVDPPLDYKSGVIYWRQLD